MNLNSVIFQYKPDVSVETLLRHHRVPRWLVVLCSEACIIFFASIAQGLVFGSDIISMTIMLTALGVAVLLIIPAILCFPWMNDIEKELAARRIAVPGGRRMEARIRAWAFHLMGWTAVIVIAALGMRWLAG